jgi:transaldolase
MRQLNVKLFADGADFKSMIRMSELSHISGLTTNPTLMRKAGVTDYAEFAKEVLREIKVKPLSFEVFSDEPEEMAIQARKIASWGNNVYVKIPVTNTRGESTAKIIENLTSEGIKVNVTAVMTAEQVSDIAKALNPDVASYVSVFAGRIADTGRDPIPTMLDSLEILSSMRNSELIWASPREFYNLIQAEEIGCHIITATTDILNKLSLLDYDLNSYSLDTVKMFFEDAQSSNYKI